MKKLIISHGDKGGTGKSTVANIIASMLYERGESLGIIEADAGGGKKNTGGSPDVMPRFLGRIKDAIELPLTDGKNEASDAVARLMEFIDDLDCEYIVMNAPANASTVLEQPEVGEILAEALGELEIDLRVAYSWSPGSAINVKNARSAVQGSIFGAASHGVLVKNEHFADDTAYESAIQGDKVLKATTRATIPRLSKHMAPILDEYGEHSLAELCDAAGPLSTMQRIRLQKFYRVSAENLASALEINDSGEGNGQG